MSRESSESGLWKKSKKLGPCNERVRLFVQKRKVAEFGGIL